VVVVDKPCSVLLCLDGAAHLQMDVRAALRLVMVNRRC
jgi:hypothetical protein